jgi:hypothetical protein
MKNVNFDLMIENSTLWKSWISISWNSTSWPWVNYHDKLTRNSVKMLCLSSQIFILLSLCYLWDLSCGKISFQLDWIEFNVMMHSWWINFWHPAKEGGSLSLRRFFKNEIFLILWNKFICPKKQRPYSQFIFSSIEQSDIKWLFQIYLFLTPAL